MGRQTGDKTLRFVFIMTLSEPFDVLKESQAQIRAQYPNLFEFADYETGLLDSDGALLEECKAAIRTADFVFLRLHGTVTGFKGFPDILPLLEGKKIFFQTGIEDENTEMAQRMHLYPDQYRTIVRYYNNADGKSLADMQLYIAQEILEAGSYGFEEPKNPKWDGIYDHGPVEDEEAYLKNIEGRKEPVVGLLVHWYNYSQNDMAHVDALVEKLRELGAVPLCVYSQIVPDEEMGFGGVAATLRHYFRQNGRTRIGCLLNLTSFSVTVLANPGNGSSPQQTSVFQFLSVPVLQVMVSSYSFEEWDKAPSGVHPLALSFQVFEPEFDGQLIAYPVAYTHTEVKNGERRNKSLPIAERVDRLCRLAVNWARLRSIPMEEKKIAVILHNLPPRNDTIGCASGLDTPESVYRMVCDWQAKGLTTEYSFADGQEIIRRIIDGVTNDGRWSSEEEILEKSVDTVSTETYRNWYAAFSPRVQAQMERDWGRPPGEYMTVRDQLLVPGILNGNLFIGLQPPRALMEKAEELMHNTDIVCPHQYIAFYRWIEKGFGADVIVHVGTHGTLEWLPGKEVGLSEHCYPDLAIDTLPNLYPFIISNPGEGVQAKRRSYCAVVDYLIPSFVESGTYDELADLDGMMKEYYHFVLVDQSRTKDIAQRIWEVAREHEIPKDIGLSDEDARRDLGGCIDKIHAWISRIQCQEIQDGLHIFGVAPQGDRLRNLIKVLLRVKNGEIPSLRDGLCAAAGLDLADLLAHPAHPAGQRNNGKGKTNAMMLEEMDEAGRKLFLAWEQAGYPAEASEIEEILRKTLPFDIRDIRPLTACMKFAAEQVKPRVERSVRELTSLTDGINGVMVPTGQSGNPTRGNVHILPTGKNFYSVDPGAIPTRSAWETGVTLAEQLLERYEKDEGKLPENISILVYATDAMRTTGDDIAEILYLLGLRPVWLGASDRVIGLDVIPVKELGRPRIDVTLRITGLFRDSFPNLIERIEDAVNRVAALDESPEDSYVKKHIDRDMAELRKQGMSREQAFERAALRIFGDPPGTYGAGVKEMVYSKKWETREDLGKVFTAWGCHAYGKKLHGEKRYEDFSRRLAQTDVSVKNESNMESDMLGSDDFYNYYGGLVSAVSVHSGEMKPSFIPNTANKKHLELFSLHEEASKVMRARVNNPKWIEGLKPHGYKGAQAISEMVDIVFGWDATTGVIDDWMYRAIAKRYAFDKENTDWIKDVNVFAMQNIVERLLEAVERGMWNATEEEAEDLRAIYMEVEGDIESLHS